MGQQQHWEINEEGAAGRVERVGSSIMGESQQFMPARVKGKLYKLVVKINILYGVATQWSWR